uniref:Late nodulin domain-containing protein n=1 Tax=Trifolium repens TaxID=3899 RepID=Q8RVZ6_TRIRP|nr:hypothetical protein [Trifolium repens]
MAPIIKFVYVMILFLFLSLFHVVISKKEEVTGFFYGGMRYSCFFHDDCPDNECINQDFVAKCIANLCYCEAP